MIPTRSRWVFVAAAAASGCLLLPGTAGATAAAGAGPAVTPVTWSRCPAGVLPTLPADRVGRYSCARTDVPLDYRHPGRGTISLGLLRRPADDQAHKIGSLFINPGGPGGSGLLWPVWLDGVLPAVVTDRFDLVGFDPRGVGRSTPLRCFTTWPEAFAVFDKIVDVPVTREEITGTLRAAGEYTDACAANAGLLLEHMSTTEVAMDLDRMRAAVGDRRLNFLGYSYGTLLGATYVNLFPHRARAIVLDGNVDPVLRTHDGLEYLRQRATGQEAVIDAFLALCARVGERCSFAAGGDPAAKFAAMRGRLLRGPVEVPVLGTITMGVLASGVASSLYRAEDLPGLADALQAAYQELFPAESPQRTMAPQAAGAALRAFADRAAVGGGVVDERPAPPGAPVTEPGAPAAEPGEPAASAYSGDNASLGVNCTDEPFPRRQQAFVLAADRWEHQAPTVGRMHAFMQVPCASWPVPHPLRYDGPFDRRTAVPVLLFGNYHDPATNYRFDLRMAATLGNQRLVSVDTFGHTIVGGLSACADAAAARYLVDLVVPARGTVCQPDRQPFD